MTMIEVFIEITGQHGKRTMIPGNPFRYWGAAHILLDKYGEAYYGSYLKMLSAIDAYGFIVTSEDPDGKTEIIRVPTKDPSL
jgi:hypothetical protein